MTDRTFTLEQITHAAAAPYAAALKEKSVERALRIFTDLLVDGLKALPPAPCPVYDYTERGWDAKGYYSRKAGGPKVYDIRPPRLPMKSDE